MNNCLICPGIEAAPYSRDKLRSYLQCPACSLIFVPRHQLISEIDEKNRYQAHQNDAADAGYRRYLDQVALAVVPKLKPGSTGLDFGCGSSTLLAQLLEERGFKTESYDLYFHPDQQKLNQSYDFILLIEVIEHLREPLKVMQDLKNMLKPHGSLFIKTKFEPGSVEAFDNWFYKRDTTHVQFFSLPSMMGLAQKLNLGDVQIIGEDLVMLTSST